MSAVRVISLLSFSLLVAASASPASAATITPMGDPSRLYYGAMRGVSTSDSDGATFASGVPGSLLGGTTILTTISADTIFGSGATDGRVNNPTHTLSAPRTIYGVGATEWDYWLWNAQAGVYFTVDSTTTANFSMTTNTAWAGLYDEFGGTLFEFVALGSQTAAVTLQPGVVYDLAVGVDGNDGPGSYSFTFTVVPEPSIVALALAGSTMLLIRKRHVRG